jgi:NAD(P)H-dependent flavin oxidoreductase YrpB (nitropropane dioxygenase family)
MNVAAGPELAAAVTNAGGLGVIGGVGYTPKILRSQVRSRTGIEYFRLLDQIHTLSGVGF